MKPKLTFAERSGELIHVAEVERGRACGCTCPGCGATLIAKKGLQNSHHFAHERGADCAHAVETALHKAAKTSIEQAGRIRLPKVVVKFDSYKQPWEIYPEDTVVVDSVRLETREATVVPDVIVEIGGRRLFIEIFVAHKVDAAKLAKIRELGVSALEVDMSAVPRAASPRDVHDLVIERTDAKSWLFNAKAESVKSEAEALGKFMVEVRRGLAHHADGCPLSVRRYLGKSYANILHDCIDCEYNVRGGFGGVTCLGFEGIVSYEDFLNRKRGRQSSGSAES